MNNSSGRVFKKSHLHEARCSKHNFALTFMTIGDYLIGIPVQKHDDDGNDLDVPYQIPNSEEAPIYSKKVSNEMREKLSEKQKNVKSHSLMTFGDCLEFLLQYFYDETIVIFRYGQKQELDELEIERLDNACKMTNVIVDVAIAGEINDENNYIAANLSQFVGHECYSFMQSKQAGNSKILNAGVWFIGGYKLMLYNTIQHIRKYENYILKTSSTNQSFKQSMNCNF